MEFWLIIAVIIIVYYLIRGYSEKKRIEGIPQRLEKFHEDRFKVYILSFGDSFR